MKKLLLFITIAFVGMKAVAQAPENGLLAYYNFNTDYNSHDNNHNMVAAYSGTNPTLVTGKYGNGISCGSYAGLVNSTLSSAINTNEFTVAWWQKRASMQGSYDTSYEIGASNYFRGNSAGVNNGKNTNGAAVGTGQFLTENVVSNLTGYYNTWIHCAYTFKVVGSNVTIRYYYDSSLATTVTVLGSALHKFTNKFTIGCGTDGAGAVQLTKYFSGVLDEFYVYNRELSAIEIDKVKNNSNGQFTNKKPDVSQGSVDATATSANIIYLVRANGADTNVILKYGTTSGMLTNQVAGGFWAGSNNTTGNYFTTPLTGLSPNTSYYVQLEATNVYGTTTTVEQSFITDPAPSLIAQYNFDNTYHDINGNNPFSTNNGTSFTNDRNSVANAALNINNTGSSATILGLPYLNQERTVSVWAKINTFDTTGYNHFYGYGTAGTSMASGGSLIATGNLSNPITSVAHLGYANNHSLPITGFDFHNWQHFIFVYDGSNSKVYVNGTLYGTLAKTWNTTMSSDIFTVGEFMGEKYFNGALDDLKIYNFAVSDAQALNLFNSNSLISQNFQSNNLKATIYPNPAKDILNIQLENELKSVEIYSLLGQIVMTSNNKQINISGLPKGIYNVKIEDKNNAVVTQKLIIK